MNRKRLWIAAAIIAAVILIAFALSVPHTKDVGSKVFAEKSAPSTPAVSYTDSYKKGLHTISGSIDAANACTVVIASASLSASASTTQSIVLEIMTESDQGICLQVRTPTKFQATIAAPQSLPITLMVNGAVASTSSP